MPGPLSSLRTRATGSANTAGRSGDHDLLSWFLVSSVWASPLPATAGGMRPAWLADPRPGSSAPAAERGTGSTITIISRKRKPGTIYDLQQQRGGRRGPERPGAEGCGREHQAL